MVHFRIPSCPQGSVYTYNNDTCFATKPDVEINERCKIDVLRDGVLYVKDFYLAYGTYFWYNNSKYWTEYSYDVRTGVNPWKKAPVGYQVYKGDQLWLSGTTRLSEFDICLIVAPENITLLGGNTTEGNVYLNGQPICDTWWGNEEATVVCRKLGFDYGEPTKGSFFGDVEHSDFIMSDVECRGSESSIWNCLYDIENFVGCYSNDGAGVICGNDSSWFNMDWFKIWHIAVVFGVISLSNCWCCCKARNRRKAQAGDGGTVIIPANTDENYWRGRTNVQNHYYRPENVELASANYGAAAPNAYGSAPPLYGSAPPPYGSAPPAYGSAKPAYVS